MRAFIAVELPNQIKKYLSGVQEKIGDTGHFKGKFVEPYNLHLTLRFLGEINEREAEMVRDALNAVKKEKFKVKLGKAGGIPSLEYIKVVYVELISDELKKLKEEVDRVLGDMFPREKREWKSHVTLARIKNIKRDKKKEIKNFLENLEIEKKEFLVDEISLIKSELTKSGPKYETLKKIKLS